MLKFFAHCWLILSLLVAPLQFAAADMAVVDHADMKCEMMDMHAGHDMQGGPMTVMDHDMTQGACDCPDQCKVSCASAHISLGMHNTIQFAAITPASSMSALSTSIHGITQLTEHRPPKA